MSMNWSETESTEEINKQKSYGRNWNVKYGNSILQPAIEIIIKMVREFLFEIDETIVIFISTQKLHEENERISVCWVISYLVSSFVLENNSVIFTQESIFNIRFGTARKNGSLKKNTNVCYYQIRKGCVVQSVMSLPCNCMQSINCIFTG